MCHSDDNKQSAKKMEKKEEEQFRVSAQRCADWCSEAESCADVGHAPHSGPF